ncbi:MAG: erg10, acetyl-CoA C-acetyltransferase [Watsoniomyces obsoletus]|nr:MAG: erg10, acetyl-CoA C-acetyltransferase [Watsoniomyces obsoletus]
MDRLAGHMAANRHLLQLFATGYNPSQQALFVKESTELLVDIGQPHSSPELCSDLCAWIAKHPQAHEQVTIAWEAFREGKKRQRALHNRLVTDLNFRQTKEALAHRVAQIPVVWVTKSTDPYPPIGSAVCENQKIHDQWKDHLESGPQPDDARRPRALPLLLDFNKLQYNAGPTEDVIFRDKETGEIVGLVMRNFIPHEMVRSWAADIIREAMASKKGVRHEDTGTLVLEGYCSRARNKPIFGWAYNLERLSLPSHHDQHQLSKYRSSSLFALFWNCLLKKLPLEVMEDMNEFLKTSTLPGMDTSTTGKVLPRYTITIDGIELGFQGGQLAPPSGAFRENYSQEIHTESSPHRYVYSWNNQRSVPDSHGGNFFFARHAVRIAASENMCLVHEPRQPHGTGLPDRGKDKEGRLFFTRGLTIFTSGPLEKSWRDLQEKKATMEEIQKKMEETDNVEVH